MIGRWIDSLVAWLDEVWLRAHKEPEAPKEDTRELSKREWVSVGDGWEELRGGANVLAVVRPVSTSEGPQWQPMVPGEEWCIGDTYETPEQARTAAESAISGSA